MYTQNTVIKHKQDLVPGKLYKVVYTGTPKHICGGIDCNVPGCFGWPVLHEILATRQLSGLSDAGLYPNADEVLFTLDDDAVLMFLCMEVVTRQYLTTSDLYDDGVMTEEQWFYRFFDAKGSLYIKTSESCEYEPV